MAQNKVNGRRSKAGQLPSTQKCLVSACGGDGKTAVLSAAASTFDESFACPDVWSVLVVTFTRCRRGNALPNRKTAKLRDGKPAADAALRRHLRHQLILLGAAISAPFTHSANASSPSIFTK